MSKKLTTEEFIEKAKKIHGDKYDYSLVNYIDNKTRVKIIHNGFVYEQRPDSHLTGRRCDDITKKKLTTEEFIKRSKEIHGDKYDYSKVKYLGINKCVEIIYRGATYRQKPQNHLIGQCPEKKSNRLSSEIFIKKSREIHGDKYDYSLVEYVDSHTEVEIIYNNVVYKQKPYNHLSGKSPRGTENRNVSKGELNIEKYLIEHRIDFIKQHWFVDCRNILPLPFDFYLPKLNTLIEYDGKQHFESVDLFGGEKGLKIRKECDSIKNKYCEKNRISLLRISYLEDVKYKLDKYLTTSYT